MTWEREDTALVILGALGVAALLMGRDEGLYLTIINAVTAVIIVAKKKEEATIAKNAMELLGKFNDKKE